MALPTLTLTDPQNIDADMSLAMSPITSRSPDTFTSFEFERTSGRPGTASSVGDGAGMYVIICMIISVEGSQRKCMEKEALSELVLVVSNLFLGLSTWDADADAATSPKQCKGCWRMRVRTNRAELS